MDERYERMSQPKTVTPAMAARVNAYPLKRDKIASGKGALKVAVLDVAASRTNKESAVEA